MFAETDDALPALTPGMRWTNVVAWCCLGLVFLSLCAAALLAPFTHGDSQFTLLGSPAQLTARGAVGGALRTRLLLSVASFAVASACFTAAGALRRPDPRISRRGVALAVAASLAVLTTPLAVAFYLAKG